MKFRLCVCREFLSGTKSDNHAYLPPVCRNMDDVYIQGVRRGINDKNIKYAKYDTVSSDTNRPSSAQKEDCEDDSNRNDLNTGAEL